MLRIALFFFFFGILGMRTVSSVVLSDESTVKPQLTACGHHDYPPWNWRSGDNIIGACAEITQSLFATVGVTVSLTYVGPWARCQKLIEKGEIDINICSFINEERQGYSEFVKTPMGYNENAVFVERAKVFYFKEWSDLIKRRAAMVTGVSLGPKFDAFLEKNINVIRVNNYEQTFKLLLHDRADFVPVGRYSGLTMIKMYGYDDRIVDLPEPILKGALHISMSKRSKYLDLIPKVERNMQGAAYLLWVDSLLKKYTQKYAEDYIQKLLKK